MNILGENKKESWSAPLLTQLYTDNIRQEISEQDSELLNLLANDKNAFRLLTGSV